MTWQPIETAPKDGSHMILGCSTYVDCGYWDDGWTLYPDDTAPHDNYCVRFNPEPTHWMPLPEPPK
jgi:allantoicase